MTGRTRPRQADSAVEPGNAQPMLAPRPLPAPPRRYTDKDYADIRLGVTAREMEERWNIWCNGDVIHVHRSWTGFEIYRATFTRLADGWAMTEVACESDRERFNSPTADANDLVALIDDLMLDGDEARLAPLFARDDRVFRARAALDGVRVGDALGSQFFVPENRPYFNHKTTPPPPWPWTDDTQMAWVLATHLRANGEVRQDGLAADFATHFDLYRGYGPGAGRLLRLVRDGGDWRELSTEMFGGSGSYGNGAAMRVAPLGAWFAADLDAVVAQATLSAEVTHRHPDGIAGAVAVAVAAALASADDTPAAGELLTEVIDRTTDGEVRAGLQRAREIPQGTDPLDVARELGNGSRTAAHDTVPFCLWVAAHGLDDYRKSFWDTASAGGDIDTTCAIVGGIVAANVGPAGIPEDWRESAEELPEAF